MPVRTRSQRRKEEAQESGINNGNETMDIPRKERKPRTTIRRKALNRNEETKSEELNDYRTSTEELRKYVKNILDSPNTIDLPTQNKNKIQNQLPPMASPRIERITIKQTKNKNMEFLIPPKQKDDAIEIREKIRAALNSNNDEPEYVQSVSNSIDNVNGVSPIANNISNKQKADQISKLLIILIFSILIAVFCGYFQQEIVDFVNTQLKHLTPMGQSINQGRESILNIISTIWTSIISPNEK